MAGSFEFAAILPVYSAPAPNPWETVARPTTQIYLDAHTDTRTHGQRDGRQASRDIQSDMQYTVFIGHINLLREML